MSKPVYSFGIIFKNEIRCLERCLKSLQPLRDAVSCEVVMADTGSTDGSREVAERYADILFDFPWINDFAAARNAVMDHCSGVWYFSIDADEWLAEDITELVAFSKEKKLPRDFGGVVIRNYKSKGLEKDQNYVDFLAIRLARLSTGVRYHGCIHEAWESPDGGLLKNMSLQDTMLYHDGYVYENKAAEQAKRDRNMPLLRKKLAEHPDDIQTLTECIDSTKHHDIESADFARQAIVLVNEKKPYWDKLGAVVFRNAVSVAQLHHLPEMEEWAEEGLTRFPDSMFIQVDLAYYTFVHYFDKENYVEAARWGEMYQRGVANYREGCFTTNEFSRGVLEFISPFWERKVSVLMPQVYLELGEPEKALAGIRAVKGGELENAQQVELCVNILMRIHRTTWLDSAAATAAFWGQINVPFPDEKQATMRRGEFLRTASKAFTKSYQAEEVEKEGFLRHSFGAFSALGESCGLGTAAAMLETKNARELERLLGGIENWNEFPMSGLSHALECGAQFPIGQRTMPIEEMDAAAVRLAQDKDSFFPLLQNMARQGTDGDFQRLCWLRGLLIAAVRSFDWSGTEVDQKQGMELARAFARTEEEFLPQYYAQSALREETLFALPPIHRFGWYCAQAFRAVKGGDVLGYVRFLRAGLGVCPSMKPMVEFLVESSQAIQRALAPAELKLMAEQIRLIIARFGPNDPALAELKASAAYQKVAYLIEE